MIWQLLARLFVTLVCCRSPPSLLPPGKETRLGFIKEWSSLGLLPVYVSWLVMADLDQVLSTVHLC
jgi:hypothetical protein